MSVLVSEGVLSQSNMPSCIVVASCGHLPCPHVQFVVHVLIYLSCDCNGFNSFGDSVGDGRNMSCNLIVYRTVSVFRGPES